MILSNWTFSAIHTTITPLFAKWICRCGLCEVSCLNVSWENSLPLSSSLCHLEWSVGAADQSVVLSGMTQVAAATLSSGHAVVWWRMSLFLSSFDFSSTFLFILLSPICRSPLLSPPHTFSDFWVLFQLSWAVTQNKMRNLESSLSAMPTDRSVSLCVCVCVYVFLIRLYFCYSMGVKLNRCVWVFVISQGMNVCAAASRESFDIGL